MAILTKYLIRAHLGPFLFALSVLTGMLFLNVVAQRLEDLAGKGLPGSVIAEFFFLSLPHVIALTLPMSVLVAVLYAFSEITSANEFTAMAAGGVKPQRILLPIIGVGVIISLSMFYFNDRILPETNHRLKILGIDINEKSPTFQLREQVVNEIRTTDGRSRYYLQAVDIDPVTNELRDVAIYDLSDPTRHRTIYADHGTMAFNPGGTDLYLTLFDGRVHEVTSDQPRSFNRLEFRQQIIPLRGVADELQRQTEAAFRSDREMSIDMLADAAREKEEELEGIRQEARDRSRTAVAQALGMEEAPRPLGSRAMRSQRQSTAGAPRGLPSDALIRGVAMNLRTQATRERVMSLQRARYRVEIHKKYAIAFACFVFVLLGAPIAVRFPRGGVGMVITVSMAIFAIYWMGLIGGEKMADSGRMDPVWAMWTTNFLGLVAGLWLVARMGREVSTTRGGGWEDLIQTLKRSARRPFRALAGAAGSSS